MPMFSSSLLFYLNAKHTVYLHTTSSLRYSQRLLFDSGPSFALRSGFIHLYPRQQGAKGQKKRKEKKVGCGIRKGTMGGRENR